MRNLKMLRYLVILASSLLFFQCTSEQLYLPGEDGIDGIDGRDGTDGTDGEDASAAVCISCHSSTHRDPIINSYASSAHAVGGSWARGTSANCAQCHNNEGFIDKLSGEFFVLDDDGDPAEHPVTGELMPSANPDGYAVSNPITCTGCHTDHRSFDFDTDGNDYAVRNLSAVHLDLDPTISIDFSTSSADELGLSNLCITCHQPRTSYPIPDGVDDVTITSRRFGPHHGPQSTMLEGIMGANIAGSTGYPGVGSAAHRAGSSCTSCHMGETTDGSDGSHTWLPTENACITCHTNGAPTEVSGYAADFQTLHNLLLAANLINESGYVLGADGVAYASSSNPLVVPVKTAQAIWNYKTLAEDNSEGIHNPGYARALLKNSIEALQ